MEMKKRMTLREKDMSKLKLVVSTIEILCQSKRSSPKADQRVLKGVHLAPQKGGGD